MINNSIFEISKDTCAMVSFYDTVLQYLELRKYTKTKTKYHTILANYITPVLVRWFGHKNSSLCLPTF